MTLITKPSIINPGRVAGFWYSTLIVISPLRLVYIPGKLFVADNPAATVNNISAHELLFRVGIVATLASALVLILLTLALYRLFAGVDRTLASEVVIFGGVMQPSSTSSMWLAILPHSSWHRVPISCPSSTNLSGKHWRRCF
jgi:hypothetical protein